MHMSRILPALLIAIATPLVAQDTTKVAVGTKTSASAHVTTPRRHRYTQDELKAMAKISQDSAQVIALAQVPGGTVTEAELEHERHTVVYSFDISQAGKTGVDEVLVSAITGKVLWKGHESARHERAEQRREGRRATRASNDSTKADTTKKP